MFGRGKKGQNRGGAMRERHVDADNEATSICRTDLVTMIIYWGEARPDWSWAMLATVRFGAYARSGFTRTQLPSLFDCTKCSQHMIWSFRERIWGMKCTIQRKLFSLYYFIHLFLENMFVLCIRRKDGVYMSGTTIAIVGHVEMKTCTRHHDNKLVLRVATLCAPQ
jgi:hypothetical protein